MLIISITISVQQLLALLTSVLIACPNSIRKTKTWLATALYLSPSRALKVLTQQELRKKQGGGGEERVMINLANKNKGA